MKILHTADWHIGKKLHKVDLSEDFELFTTWLCTYLDENPVDVLLISGDVFDFSNPSSESRTLYYKTLIQLKAYELKIIITGGNHDSPSVLNAPKELLNQLDIHVVGQMPQQLEDCLIPISGAKDTELVVAAIPFLRSKDLQQNFEAENYDSKLEAVQQSIAFHFQEVAKLSKNKYPRAKLIGMGHLFATGASLSESERDIQVGNLAGLEATHFGNDYAYVALGHIHKPQRITAQTPIYYSGSPIPLSFSERKNEKRLLLLDTEATFEPKHIALPKFRDLILIKGSLEAIKQKLNAIHHQSQLTTLIEIEMLENEYSASKIYELEQLIENFDTEGCEIVKHKVSFKNKSEMERGVSSAEQQITEFSPQEVFLKKLNATDETESSRQELLLAFEAVLEEINMSEE